MFFVSWFGFLAFLAYFVGMVALHFLPTGRRPLYNTISDYSLGRFGNVARMLTAVNVIGIVCLIASLMDIVGSPPLTHVGLISLVVLAASRLGLVFILTNESGTKVTVSGFVHSLLATVSFIAGISAITTITKDISGVHAWHGVQPILGVLSALSFPLVVALALALLPRLRRVFGLIERLFLIDVNAWLLIAAGLMTAHGGSL